MPWTSKRFPEFFKLATSIPFILLVAFACPSIAQDCPPFFSLFAAGLNDGNACCSDHETWVVDATGVPTQGNLESGIRSLRYWRTSPAGCRREYSSRAFYAAMTPDIPTLFYVHGYGLGENGAVIGSSRLANYFRPCAGGKFRTVTWVWDARHQLFASPLGNIRDKSQNAEAQGYYLANTIRQLSPDLRIAFVGHSFGCRSVCACLQGLATNIICQNFLPSNGLEVPRRMEATLIAPGVENFALGPSGRYSLALSQVERMQITYNPDDRVLRGLAFLTRDSNVMGLTGPYTYDWSTEQLSKVTVSNMNAEVFAAHRVGPYTHNPASRPAIFPRILGR
jgi:Alpha/beta hydrolase of unknown function (DUF900)